LDAKNSGLLRIELLFYDDIGYSCNRFLMYTLSRKRKKTTSKNIESGSSYMYLRFNMSN